MTAARERLFQQSDISNTGQFTLLDWVLFVGVSLIWGSSFLLIAYALEDFNSGTVSLGRVGLGALALGVVRATSSTKTSLEPEDRSRVLVLSLVWVAIPFTLFPIAQQYINSAVTGLLNGATPIFVAVVSTLLLKAAPKGLQLIGIVVGFVGVVMISLASSGGNASETKGVLMVLAATGCYGFAINLAGPLQSKYGAIETMSRVLGLATLWVAPYGLWNIADNSFSWRSAAALVFLGAAGTGAAYWIMATLVGRIGAVRASFITYLIPVVSLVLGVVFRDDLVTGLALVGAVLTVGGAFIASRRQSG